MGVAWFDEAEWAKAVERWPELLEEMPAEHLAYKAAIEAPDELAGSVSFIAQLRQGAGKIEISSGNLAVNNSRFPFTGAIGPDPVNGTQAGPAQYRFEVVTNDSRLSPMDTQEPHDRPADVDAHLHHPEDPSRPDRRSLLTGSVALAAGATPPAYVTSTVDDAVAAVLAGLGRGTARVTPTR